MIYAFEILINRSVIIASSNNTTTGMATKNSGGGGCTQASASDLSSDVLFRQGLVERACLGYQGSFKGPNLLQG